MKTAENRGRLARKVLVLVLAIVFLLIPTAIHASDVTITRDNGTEFILRNVVRQDTIIVDPNDGHWIGGRENFEAPIFWLSASVAEIIFPEWESDSQTVMWYTWNDEYSVEEDRDTVWFSHNMLNIENGIARTTVNNSERFWARTAPSPRFPHFYEIRGNDISISLDEWTYFHGFTAPNGFVFESRLDERAISILLGESFLQDYSNIVVVALTNDTPPTTEPTITPTVTPDTISVTIDGAQVNFADQPPALVDGRTLVPVRGVFEALGFEVNWNSEYQVATLSRYDYSLNIGIGRGFFNHFDIATNETVRHDLDVPAQIIGGRTMLPIRAVLESVGYFVDWDSATQTVLITS